MMADARQGGDQQHGSKHELERAGEQRGNPTRTGHVGGKRLVDLACGLLKAEQAPHDGNHVERFAGVEQRNDAEHDHDHIRADGDFSRGAVAVEKIGHDVRSAHEQHDRTQDMRQMLGDLLREQQTGDAQNGKQQRCDKGDPAGSFLIGEASIHLDTRHNANLPVPAAVRRISVANESTPSALPGGARHNTEKGATMESAGMIRKEENANARIKSRPAEYMAKIEYRMRR